MIYQHQIKPALIALALIMSGGYLSGQTPLDIDEIKVIAPYEPSISDAFKININPVIQDTMTVDIDFDYSIRPQKIVTRFTPEPLNPARMRGEPLTKLYRGLVKGGFGNYQTPYFEGFYNTLRSNEYALGVHLRHLSSNNDIKGFDNSTFSQNRANVYGTRFFRNTALDADVLFNRHVVHYYGMHSQAGDEEGNGDEQAKMDNGWPPSGDPFIYMVGQRQRLELLSSTVGFGTHHNDSSKLSYRFGFEHNWLSDRYESSEHHFRASTMLGRQLSEEPIGGAQKQYFRLDVTADYYYDDRIFSADSSAISNTGIYRVQPAIYSYHDKLKFHIGVNLSVEDDNASYELRAWPLAGFEASLSPGSLLFFVNLSGGLEKQSYRKLSEANPFVNPGSTLQFLNTRHRISGGFKGALGANLSYELSLTHSKLDNQAFFINLFSPNAPYLVFDNRFGVAYDDVNLLNLSGVLSGSFGDRFQMRFQADYFHYDMKNMRRAWHMPDFTASLNARYNIQDKIILTADLFGRGTTYGLDLAKDGGTMPVVPDGRKLHGFYVDANLGIEYRYTKLLSVFLKFHNMQNESYERWTHYPTQGFGFLGGVSYAF